MARRRIQQALPWIGIAAVVLTQGSILLAIALVSLAGVGVFPEDGPYHFEAASGFSLLFSVATRVLAVG